MRLAILDDNGAVMLALSGSPDDRNGDDFICGSG